MNKVDDKLEALGRMIELHRQSLEPGYMHGMLNGMIFAHSLIDDTEPKYADVPRRVSKNMHGMNVRHKSVTKIRHPKGS